MNARLLPRGLLALGVVLLAACGERNAAKPGDTAAPASGGATSPAPARVLEPAEHLAALAARSATPAIVNPGLAAWRERVRGALASVHFVPLSLSVRAWERTDAQGGKAQLWGTEAEVEIVSESAPVRASVRLTACAAAPALAAAEEQAYLTEMEGGGHIVVPVLLGDDLTGFRSTWDDPQQPTLSWHRGELVVRALGFDSMQIAYLGGALEAAGLYGAHAPTSPRPPPRPSSPKETAPAPEPDDPDLTPADPSAPAAPWTPPKSTTPSEDAPDPFVGRWHGTVDGSDLTLDIDIQRGFTVVNLLDARRKTASGHWEKTATGLKLTITHEDGKLARRGDSVFVKLVDGKLELHERSNDSAMGVLERVP